MFISYIIPPFQSDAYLVRCIESLYGQTSDDFEVIVAEYHFSGCKDYIKDALETKPNFKIIEECRSEEKLASAVRMINPSAEFVQFVDVSTVAVPHALETLRTNAEDAQILLPASILRMGNHFIKRFAQGWENAEQFGVLTAYDYCFRKTLFDRYAESMTADLNAVEILVDTLIGSGTKLSFIAPVCYYVTKSEFVAPAIPVNDYDKLQVISANIDKEELGSVKVKLFTKYVHRLISVIDSKTAEYPEQCKAYEILRLFGENASANTTLSKIFVLNTAVPVSDMQELDLNGYRTLRSELFRLSDTQNSVSMITEIFNNYNLKRDEDAARLERWIKNYNDERKAAEEENKKMREDIAALTANMHLLMQRIEDGNFGTGGGVSVSAFHDPITEVPYLFATGKLGMKAIFKCISGWFRFKFSRKK